MIILLIAAAIFALLLTVAIIVARVLISEAQTQQRHERHVVWMIVTPTQRRVLDAAGYLDM